MYMLFRLTITLQARYFTESPAQLILLVRADTPANAVVAGMKQVYSSRIKAKVTDVAVDREPEPAVQPFAA